MAGGVSRHAAGAVALVAGAALAVAAPTALAGSAVVGGGTVVYTAAAGEVNDVTVTLAGGDIVLDEAVLTETGTADCPRAAGALRCPAAGVTRVDLLLGDEDDAADGATAGVSLVLRGEDGADVLRGGGASDVLEGGEGDDLLDGRADDDLQFGEDGDDTIAGGSGADALAGGSGRDHLDHADGPAGVQIDLQAGASAGGDADGDVVSPDVEWVTGTPFADVLAGTDAAGERLEGGDGGDVLEGRDGSDVLAGGSGQDALLGGDGGDVLDGGPGGDDLVGGALNDLVTYADSPAAVTAGVEGAGAGGYAAGDSLTAVETLVGSPFGDELIGASGAEWLYGGEGDDLVRGLGGDDLVFGDGGDDRLDGGAGRDVLAGSDGVDTVDYSDRERAVTADPDGASDDGEAGEGDLVTTDVEGILGGAGDDDLSARDPGRASVLRGGAGDDLLDVGDGAGGDRAEGGDGTDVATADAGDLTSGLEEPAPPASAPPGSPGAGPVPARVLGPDVTPPLMRVTRAGAPRSRGAVRSVALTLTDDRGGGLVAEVVLLGRAGRRCARLDPVGAVVERPRRPRGCAPRRAVVLPATGPLVLRVPPAGYRLRVTPRDSAGNRGAPAVISGARLRGD